MSKTRSEPKTYGAPTLVPRKIRPVIDITVIDSKCCDCSGACTLYLVPDKMWKALGLDKEWICVSCLVRRLEPTISAEEIAACDYEEVLTLLRNFIYSRRRKFKLKRINRFKRARVECSTLVRAVPGEGLTNTMTLKQLGMGG